LLVALASSHPIHYGQTISETDFKNNPKTRRGKELTNFKVRVRVTLRLAVYRQLVRLGDKPLETDGQ
jgi:hypothetical protein